MRPALAALIWPLLQITPAKGCAYSTFAMQLRPAFLKAELPIMRPPVASGVLRAPLIKRGCSFDVGLGLTLRWNLAAKGGRQGSWMRGLHLESCLN
jgi:hypothetical protein